nr:AF211533_1 Avr9/Cf-9 rapidly elicited protein 146 [Ipomoea batatas]
MEPNNLPVIAKRFWNVVRAALFMLRQGISKKKLMLDLNLRLKRGKIAAGKAAVHNLIFHHHHNHASSSSSSPAADATKKDCGGDLPGAAFADPSKEYEEFSCENSPARERRGGVGGFHLPNLNYLSILKKLNKQLRISASSNHAPPPTEEEIMIAAEEIVLQSAMASPALPGFGRTPSVRQLRVTDLPFLFSDAGSSHVDEAAENFISRFYDDLRRQNAEQ